MCHQHNKNKILSMKNEKKDLDSIIETKPVKEETVFVNRNMDHMYCYKCNSNSCDC